MVIVGKCIGQIADAVSSRSTKEDSNLVIFLESERLRAEERERIRQEERADERRREKEERRREDNRFMMMMMMLNPNRHQDFPSTVPPPLTQDSINSSPAASAQFDGQDFLNAELMRRTTGV